MVEIVKAILKRWGSNYWKQHIWDEEYSKGLWTRGHRERENMPSSRDSVLEVIEKYSGRGEILELGCGAGETAFEIADAYVSYLGVDISDVAVSRGTEAARRQSLRPGKVTFVTGDISTFAPDRPFSVILFRESIYYLPKVKIPGTLHRLSTFLTPQGVFIVRVHDREKHKAILDMIERDYGVVERCLPGAGTTATLVFRPREYSP